MNPRWTTWIQKRKSVRTFNRQPLTPEEKDQLEQWMREETNPFGIPVHFSLLDANTHHLSSPVITGETTYLAGKVKTVPRHEIAYGYAFEKICLLAKSIGLGTVILAGTLSRSAFEKAMNVAGDEVMFAASPIGHPAAKRSIRETLMRKGIKADTRVSFDSHFYLGAYGNPLSFERAGIFARALEMVRWAPSATNQQPWRVVLDGDTLHFFEAKTIQGQPDIQKVDMGIALCHFDLTLQEEGIQGKFIQANPNYVLPDNVEYIISYQKGE